MKRIFDITISLILIIILIPLFIVLIILSYFILGMPVFFIQKRPGLHGKPFKIIKFRTMLNLKNNKSEIISDDQRIHPYGVWLRSLSLDELPQIFNVLIGNMSLVGPRPLLMEYLSLYDDEQIKRHNVLPGITGWSQINGRNDITWKERLNQDLWYVENRTFLLDIKIIFLTIFKVIKRENVLTSDKSFMKKFKGKDD